MAGRSERAVIDLAEAVMLQGREGEIFPAIVTDVDERGVRMQLGDLPVVARVGAHRVERATRSRSGSSAPIRTDAWSASSASPECARR
jgi:exoribonuclease R